MTFAVAVATNRAVSVCADRKYSGVRSLSGFLGTKICRIETSDAYGMLTYAGVGAKAYAKPLEVSEWARNVLVGSCGSFDQAMTQIVHAAIQAGMAAPQYNHSFLFGGFLDGRAIVEAITTDVTVAIRTEVGANATVERPADQAFQRVRLVPPDNGVAVYSIGSGKLHFDQRMLKGVIGDLRRSVLRPGYRRRAMARLAAVTRLVSRKDQYVGPEAVCAWSDYRKTGEHQSYDGVGAPTSGQLPTVATGLDINMLTNSLMPVFRDWIDATQKARLSGASLPAFDDDAVRKATAGLVMRPRTRF